MFDRRTPFALLDLHLLTLRRQLEGLSDGRVDAIHDARVVTRQIRELLMLARGHADGEPISTVAAKFRELGQSLGKVRDIDVRVGLLRCLETHAPQTAPAVVVLRIREEHRRVERMRRLIKALERLEIEALVRDARVGAIGARSVRWFASGAWREPLRHLVAGRAAASAQRIQRATGVYFPNRSHNARIALKKLRYAGEIAELTGWSDLHAPLKTLKKAQEVLGHLHDRQDLINLLAKHRDDPALAPEHVTLSSHVLEAELREYHARYLDRRPALTEAVMDIADVMKASTAPSRAAMVGGALALSGLLYARARRIG